ncbi:MAG: family 78 glycoside hydrolase catalytic domain, partial [Acidobacteriota bacterium]
MTGFSWAQAPDLVVDSLRCEYQENPLGIDSTAPRLSWKLRSEKHGVMQAAFQVQVAGSLQDLLAGSNLLWDSGKVASDSSIQVPYAGSPLISSSQYLWRVRVWDEQDHSTAWSPVASWEMGLLQPGDWKARWISARSPEAEGRRPSPLMRKDFSISKPLASARVYVTSRGLYEVWINGVRVGDQLFTPGWTSYKTRFQYQTYDVTSLLQEGENALAALLGDGWYRGFIGFRGQQNYYGDQLALLLQVRLEFADGTTQFVTSDDTWKWSTGPILNSDIYMGETYDARLEIPGWGEAGFDDASWSQVDLAEYPTDNLIAPAGPPVRIMEEVRPVAILTTPEGDTVVDMGQNLVGWVRIQAEGEAGTVLTLRHAEVLDKAGNFYTENLRSAAQETVYTLKGSGVESFQPHFSFQGFRYVAVDGYPGELTIDKLTGVAIYSDMEPTGTLKTSNPLINQLQHNIVWGQKGNFLDVPTDCPQRDERLGWTGDAQVFARTAAFNMDVASFFTKWLGDLAADQREDGAIPFVVPDVLNGFASAAWADAGVIIPWTLYLTYGDQRILERQYDSMKAWVHYMKTRAGEDLIWDEGFHFGDWLAFATTRSDYPGATTDKDLIATAFYAYSTGLLSKAAKVIGRAEEAREYATLAQGI